jgi:membrane protein DedA with SNARE-associated domain
VPYVTTGSITGSISHWLLHFQGGLSYPLVGAGSVTLEAMMTVVVLSAIFGDSLGYLVGRTADPGSSTGGRCGGVPL